MAWPGLVCRRIVHRPETPAGSACPDLLGLVRARLFAVVTAEEIAGIEVFAMLGAGRARVAGALAADISLVPGEYAVERGRRARALRGARGPDRGGQARRRRRPGRRRAAPGDLFGEVPIALGTVFPVGFRAAEPSRVMRLEPARVPRDRGRGTRGRQEARRSSRATGSAGLQGIAAEPPPPRAILVGQPLESGVRRAAAFPRPQPDQLPVAQPDAPDAERAVGRTAAGRRRLPGDPRASTARRSSGRSFAGWPSSSGSPPSPRLPSTTP